MDLGYVTGDQAEFESYSDAVGKTDVKIENRVVKLDGQGGSCGHTEIRCLIILTSI